MPRAALLRNSGTSGVLDPLVLDRVDIEQYGQSLKTGTGYWTLPTGGWRRVPGSIYRQTAAGNGRLMRFAFDLETQFLLAWHEAELRIYKRDAGAWTQVTDLTAPYTLAQLREVRRAQEADLMVTTHAAVAPYQLFRASLPSDPIRTTSGSATVRVNHPAHDLEEGDQVGFADLPECNGIPASELNTGHAVALQDGSLGSNPFATTSGSSLVRVTHTSHPFQDGDRVKLDGSADIGGFSGITDDLLDKTHTLVYVDGDTYDIDVGVDASATVASGGGSGVTWEAPDHYEVTVTTTADDSSAVGGSGATVWKLNEAPLINVPVKDFGDESSPSDVDSQQKIKFGGVWQTGERFRLYLNKQRTRRIEYGSNTAEVASNIEDALRALPNTSIDGIRVEYDTSSGSHGGGDWYDVYFEGDDGNTDWSALTTKVLDSTSGTLEISEVIEGDSQQEPVWSATRGWPICCTFHQDALWFAATTELPVHFWKSKLGDDYFNFYAVDAQEDDGLAAALRANQVDAIRHMVSTQRLVMLTGNSEWTIEADDGKAITPESRLALQHSRYGTGLAPPVVLDGQVVFADRFGKAIRRLGYSLESDGMTPEDISRLSRHLIEDPLEMEVLRLPEGELLVVLNTDGSLVFLTYDAQQQVIAWTGPRTTDGTIRSICAMDDELLLLVERTIDGSTVFYIEQMWQSGVDYTAEPYVDCSITLTGPATTWSGLDSLEGKTVHLFGDGAWLGTEVVRGGQVTTAASHDELVVGLEYSASLVPSPPVMSLGAGSSMLRRARIPKVRVDLGNSRGIRVGGWKIPERNWSDPFASPTAYLQGTKQVRLRGSQIRPDVTIDQAYPGPVEILAVEMELVAGAH